MVASLLAILAAALLLPGIIATLAFYSVGQSQGVDVVIPKMPSAYGLALIGSFSVAVHFLYIILLVILTREACSSCWPLANPYSVFGDVSAATGLVAPSSLASAMWGLVLLLVMAVLVGKAVGTFAVSGLIPFDYSVFYGPLSELVTKTLPPNYFIVAYVLTKTETPHGLLGYRGLVAAMKHDEDRFPAKLVLTDVKPFYLQFDRRGPRRRETDLQIDQFVLASEEWTNVAFVPIRAVSDPIATDRTL